MPSKQTIANRERSLETLRALAGNTLIVKYCDDLQRYGFTVEEKLSDEVSLILCGPARYEVVLSFLVGVRYGWSRPND